MGLRHNMSEKESIGKNNKNAGMLPICKQGVEAAVPEGGFGLRP